MTRRVAVLGAGVGAEHITGYLALPERFSVSHVCGLEAPTVATQAARAGAIATDSIASVLADPMVELVDICLPPKLHLGVAIESLAAGKHVIVEKPLAGSVADCARLQTAASAATGQVFPVFQYRYGRAFDVLDALVAADLLGRPHVAALETHWSRDAAYYAMPWRGTWKAELGGAVLSHAIHIHDLLCRAFGPVAEVSAMTATRINPIETEDCAVIALRMTNGALATSSITLGAAGDSSRLRLIYENATVESGRVPYSPGGGAWRFSARDPARQADIDAVVAATPARRHTGFAGFLDAVADALDGQGQAVTLGDGAAAVELVSAIYLSERTGARIALPLDPALPICAGLAP